MSNYYKLHFLYKFKKDVEFVYAMNFLLCITGIVKNFTKQA